jgi:hypothetical protein
MSYKLDKGFRLVYELSHVTSGSEMCNSPRLVIDYQIDYHFFQSNRNRNRVFFTKKQS